MERKKLFGAAFTLIELLVVVALVAVIAGYGITNYYKTQEQAYIKVATSQLKMLEKAQEMFFVQHEFYYPMEEVDQGWASAVYSTSDINQNLKTQLIEDGFTYQCFYDGCGSGYACWAARQKESPYFVIMRKMRGDDAGTISVEESLDFPGCISS